MVNPEGHVVLGEEKARTAEARYGALKAGLQAMHLCNEELMHGLREQEEIVVAEWLREDRRAQAQMREFANLMAELMAGRREPEVQLEGMRIGVKVEKPENYDGSKQRDLHMWLF